MKKIFTLIVAMMATTVMMAQTITFVGPSTYSYDGGSSGKDSGNNAKDVLTIKIDETKCTADITIPSLKFSTRTVKVPTLLAIPFTKNDATYTWSVTTETEFKAPSGESIKVQSLSATYVDKQTIDFDINFSHGSKFSFKMNKAAYQEPTAISEVSADCSEAQLSTKKAIVGGKLVIEKNGKQYNVGGQLTK